MASQTLGDYFEKLVGELVAKGRYASRDEVLRAGLRMLEDHEKKRKAAVAEIRRMLREGAESGPAVPLDEAIARVKSGSGRRAA